MNLKIYITFDSVDELQNLKTYAMTKFTPKAAPYDIDNW